jgi:hypothetical protein
MTRQEGAEPEPEGRNVPDRVDVRLDDSEDKSGCEHREADRARGPTASQGNRDEHDDEGQQDRESEGAELEEDPDERVLRHPALKRPVAIDEDGRFRSEPVAQQRPVDALVDRAAPCLEAATRIEDAP